MKLVSVIIPTYKRSDFLDRAINSVLEQSYSKIEIIVVDDNNPDTDDRVCTEKRMQKYLSNQCIKYIQHEENKNGSAERNTGIRAAQGDYITFLDDDDYYYVDKVKQEVDFLENHNEYDGVYCWRNDVNGVTSGKYTGDISEILLLDKYMPQTTTLMFRKEIFSDVGFFDESFRRHQDVEFLIRFCKKHKIGYVGYVGCFFDTSDRKNEIHGKELEKNKELYINTFRNEIDSIKKRNKRLGNEIYVHHYVDIIADHLQNMYVLSAVKYFFKSCRISFLLTICKMIDRVIAYIKIHKNNQKNRD